ncbi:UV radiation resistance-associated gene protein-like [Oculina patagonica]
MASKESLGRVRHFNLNSQQLRLRHLRSISVRNIVPKFAVSGDSLLDCLLETYFTLHSVDGNQKAIYTSEKIKYSLNPTWASFEPSSWTEQQYTGVTSVLVRIWGGQNDKFRLIIEWEVHLPSLQYLGDQVKSSKYGHNTVFFGLIDGYYGAPSVPSSDQTGNKGTVPGSQRTDLIKIDQDQVHTSCKLSSVKRLQSMQKAILQAQLSVRDVRQSIQSKVESDMKCASQLSEEEMLELKIKLLREECLSKQKLLLKERGEEQRVLEKLREREVNLKKNRIQLDSNKTSLREHKQAHIEKRESFVKLTAQLNIRRRQLISELMTIYPIAELQDSKDFLICGVRLPNCESDEFQAMDEETLSVALGYTCHLVSMIAIFLDLPLRYPMNSRGSRSTVKDFAIEKVAEKDRQFPLYNNKGKERIQFYYGTFLLNKNIAQLRQFNGLGTPNLRNTLPNLKDLLETKFRSSDSLKSAPLTIIRKSPLKHEKKRSTSGSGGSTESSPSNPKLDDVLLKTMNASTSEAKSPLPTPLSAAQINRMQNVENPVNTGENSNSTSQRDLGDLPEESAVDARERTATAPTGNTAQLHIPSQGTSHKFLGQQRARKAIKHDDISTTKSKNPRTLSFKSHRDTSSGRHKLLKRHKSVDSERASKGTRSKVAESVDINDFVKVEMVKGDRACLQHAGSLNQDVSSTTNCESSSVDRDSNEKTDLLSNPGPSDKQLISSEGINSKSLFDVEGTIDFDFCENGDIDLR